MAHRIEIQIRNSSRVAARMIAAALALPAALVLLIAAPQQAHALAEPIPESFAAGFATTDFTPEWLLSPVQEDFLSASPVAGSGAPVVFERTEQYIWEGSGGFQDELPEGTLDFQALVSWEVTEINIDIPPNGLYLFIGGMAGPNFVPPPGTPPFDRYEFGTVSVLNDGGTVGGVTVPALQGGLLDFGNSVFQYYGIVIDGVGDTLQFAYNGEEALGNGVPFLSNVGRNYTVIPEPGTFLMVGAGLALLASRRRGQARG